MARHKPTKTNKLQSLSKREANAYDKIFKENMQSLFLSIAEKKLGIRIQSAQQLKEKRQTTLEREMDFVYLITTIEGSSYILHIEVETGDNPEMIYRMVEYNGILTAQYKLPVRNLVVYLGEKPSNMITQLSFEDFFFTFQKLEFRELNPDELLSSQMLEEVILTVLSNYPKEKAESILRLIRRKLVALCKNETELSKFFNQLMILSQLRDLDSLTSKIIREMPVTIDLRQNILFKEGVQQGIEQGIELGATKKEQEDKYLFVKNLLLKTKLDNFTIADLADVTLEFVEKMKKELKP